MVVARYVRVEPVTWAPNGPGLRLNYIGCFSAFVPTPRPPVPFYFEEPTVPAGVSTSAPTVAVPTVSPPSVVSLGVPGRKCRF